MNIISKRVKELMTKYGITEYRLSRKADINNSTLNNALKGENAWIQATYLFKIAKVFDVSVDYLVTGQKTLFDENKKINALKETNLVLQKENEELKEMNSKLQKALEAFFPKSKKP